MKRNERKKCYLLANSVILHYVFPNFRSCQLQENIGMSMQRHFKYNLFVSLVIVGLAKVSIVEYLTTCTKRMYACNRFADANVRVSDVKQPENWQQFKQKSLISVFTVRASRKFQIAVC